MAGDLRETLIRAGGIRTRVIEAGDPGCPTVVLVHDGAFGTDSELCWEGVIPELTASYHVVAPDLIGWGGTDKLCYFDRSPRRHRPPALQLLRQPLTAAWLGDCSSRSGLLGLGDLRGQGWR